MTNKEFIAKVAPIITSVFNGSNGVLPSVVIAQACLETGYGRTSELYKRYNNMFGLNNYHDGYLTDDVGSVNLTVPQERNGETIYQTEEMATFPSLLSCVKSLAKWYTRPKYKELGSTKTVQYQTQFLQGKYATSTSYASSLQKIISANKLTEYDTRYGVQLGAFTVKDNAVKFQQNQKARYRSESVDIIFQSGYYKVVMGLTYSKAEAEATQKHYNVGFVNKF